MMAALQSNQDREAIDLVYGLGATGLSVARYMQRKHLRARYVDNRESPPGADELLNICKDAETIFGDTPQALLETTARIIVSPGIADTDPLLEAARYSKAEIVSDIELFVQEADAPFIAVTGSNGKSTVTTLLALMCEAGGKAGLAGGNLGVPALDLLAEARPDYYVLELSSFQLQRTKSLPATIAILLNISPDHLDWHASEEEYRAAKYRVFAEAESAVFNRADPDVIAHLPADVPHVSFGLDVPNQDQYGLVKDGSRTYLARGGQRLLAADEVALVGTHNLLNALAALATGEQMGLELSDMLPVLKEFTGLPHRMQAVANIDGVQFINDSKATNVGAAIASVESINGHVVLIAGGQGKGGDFGRLAVSIADRLRGAVLIGEDAQELATAFAGLAVTEVAANMSEAVERASSIANHGDTVLLAPACASFDQYPNYQKRGEDFCDQVAGMSR